MLKCDDCGIEDIPDKMAFSKWAGYGLATMCPTCFRKNNPDEYNRVTRCLFCKEIMTKRVYPDTIDDVCMKCRRNAGRLARCANESSDDDM